MIHNDKRINKFLFSSLAMIFLVSLLFFSACTNRPRNVLSASKMAEVIAELHKTDGILAVLRSKGELSGDSITERYYAAVLDKFNLTQSQFDSSLVWYSKNPKRFESVYLTVDETLTQWQKDIESGKFGLDSITDITTVIFEQLAQIKIKDTADYKQVRFEVDSFPLMPHDVFTLRFLQKLDSTTTPYESKIMLKINYADAVSDSITAISHTDGLTRRFKIRFPAKRLLQVSSLSVNLLLPDSAATHFTATFDSITITRTYNIMAQDSLQKLFEKKPVAPPLDANREMLRNTIFHKSKRQ